MAGILFTLVYLGCGVFCVRCLLPRIRFIARLWLGVAFGLLLEMWLPYLSAYLFDFTLKGHLLSLLPLLLLGCAAYLARSREKASRFDEKEKRLCTALLCTALPLTLLSLYLFITHNIFPAADGSLHVWQSTYGDLNLHLGIITSFRNAKIPLDYSIYPGELLTYPFLADSLSASFMLFGCSLRFAVNFPSVLMAALVFSGYIILAERIARKRSTAVLAAMFFFLNGGLGFFYSLDMAGVQNGVYAENELQSVTGLWQRLKVMLDGWYQTPANHAEFTTYNLRWSNVIADMLIPQRTTLAGWCQLLPCLYLVYEFAAGSRFDRRHPAKIKGRFSCQISRALWKRKAITPAAPDLRRTLRKDIRLILLMAVWAGALPMVHTHSFLALGLVCAGGLVYDAVHGKGGRRLRGLLLGMLAAEGLLVLIRFAPQILSVLDSTLQVPEANLPDILFLAPVAAGWCLALICLVENRDKRRALRILRWLIFGAVTVVIAAPQLLTWTFRQASGSTHFLTLQFNWVNNSASEGLRDAYFWFYIKNIGLPFLLLLCALFEKDRKTRFLAYLAFAVFIPAECVRFQPNEYDNNKLFYVWYMISCVIAARYALKLYSRMKGLRSRRLIAAVFCAVCFLSGTISIARECVSDYESFSKEDADAAAFIEEHTPEHAMFITWTQHINPVSALAGRDIVCGPDLWLYWHGFDTWERQSDILLFLEDPENNMDIAEKYGAEYVYISPYERSNGSVPVNEDALDRCCRLIYESGGYEDIRIYEIPENGGETE